MKPTQEQEEAACHIYRHFIQPGDDSVTPAEVEKWLASRDAARDAERDARWEKRDHIAIKALTWYAVQMKGRWNGAMDMDLLAEEARLALVALGAWPIDPALANLSAEEKPRILLVEDATLPPGEAELRGSKDTIRIKNIGDAKPEPKCGECDDFGGHTKYDGKVWVPCPACSGGNP